LAIYLDEYLHQFLILPTEAELNKLAIYFDEYLRLFLILPAVAFCCNWTLCASRGEWMMYACCM